MRHDVPMINMSGRGLTLPPQGIGSLITGLREVRHLKSGYLATRLKDIGLTEASIHGKGQRNFGSLFVLSFNSLRYNQSPSFSFQL